MQIRTVFAAQSRRSSLALLAACAGAVSALGSSASGQAPFQVADLVTVATGQPASSNPRFARPLADGTVLFTAADYEGGRQGILFRTDGTTTGTQLVDTSLSIRCALSATSFLDPWSRGAGPVCFYNDLGEIWRTDATSRGTIRLGPQSTEFGTVIAAPQGSPSVVTTANSRVFWLSNSATPRLMFSNGSAIDGATAVVTLPAPYPALTGWNLATLGNRVVFAGVGPSGALEPFGSDGTPIGTARLSDLTGTAIPTNPRWFTVFNSRAYFVAGDGATGVELWSTDGTARGTSRFADLAPGAQGSSPEFLVVSGGLLWFTAETAATGRVFWHTNGIGAPVPVTGLAVPTLHQGLLAPQPYAGGVTFATSASTGGPLFLIGVGGPVRLTPQDGSISHFNVATPPVVVPGPGNSPGTIYFTGQQAAPILGQELFAATAVASSARLVLDISAGVGSSLARPLAPLPGNRLLLAASVGADRELYVSDGTAMGTLLLRDLNQNSASSNPSRVFAGDSPDQIAFTSDSTAYGRELFRTDGTASGTVPLVEVLWGSAGRRRLVYRGDTVWFSAYDGDSSTTRDVFQHVTLTSLGDFVGTVKNVVASQPPITIGDNLIYTANNGGTIWPFNTTAWGVGEAFIAAPLINVEISGPSSPSRYFKYEGEIYFGGDAAPGSDVARRLYRSDGTPLSTEVAWDLGTSVTAAGVPQIVGAVNSRLIVSYGAPADSGIFTYDPASAETTLLAPGYSESQSLSPIDSAVLGGLLYFASGPPEGTDFELVRTDATAQGTIRVADIEPGVSGSAPRGLFTARTAMGDRIFFSAQTSQQGREVWTSDGTQQGTSLLADLFPGIRGSNPANFFELAPGRIIFTADDGLTGTELWETDGTAAGTRQIADINPGTESSWPSSFSIVGGRLWFSAFTRASGRELWSMALDATNACNYDFNQDENVDLTDAQQMAQVFVGLITRGAGWIDGDLNGDENADLTDAQLLAAYVVTGVCGV